MASHLHHSSIRVNWMVVFTLLVLHHGYAFAQKHPSKISHWDRTLRGAVYSGYYGDGVGADLNAARKYGFDVVRLFFPGSTDTPKPTVMPGAMTEADLRDWDSQYFESDRFKTALQTLDKTIAGCAARNIRVVISPGLVPGSHGKGPVRWRLYRKWWWHDRLGEFWKRLAMRYGDNRNVIGYLLLNEPGFEVTQDLKFDDEASVSGYYKRIEDTPGDLNAIYQKTIAAIRSVDTTTPIIIQPGQFGRPQALRYLKPIDDDRAIYCFHWYGPWLYTTFRKNKGRWKYPGDAPSHLSGDSDAPGPIAHWDIHRLRKAMAKPVRDWQSRHKIPSHRIYIGEFGADRRVAGAERWLDDVLTIIEENGWHWTYYMFREREWNAMDQELGPGQDSTKRSENQPGMRVILKHLGN